MDIKWFKQRQKMAGVTAEDIAKEMGRDRSSVSKIYNEQQTMTLAWAKAFAKVLDVSLDEVLERAGALDPQDSQTIRPGFSESDAVAWIGKDEEMRKVEPIAAALGQRPGVDIWQIKTAAMSFMGYMPGDYMLLDTHAAERVRPGDVVVAQVYDRDGAATVLRRYEPPVLVSSGPDATDRRVHVVDGSNVVVMGRVAASWRA